MSKNYNTRTASLKATIADIRNLDAKQINAEKISLNGQNIEDLWGFQTPQDFKKLCTRCELPEDKPWALWTDAGNLVYFNQSDRIVNGKQMFENCSSLTSFASNLSSLADGTDMFNSCINLTSFNSDLSSLIVGYRMFYGCSNLTSFTSDLSSLTDGSNMFNSCSNLTSFSSDLSSLVEGYNMFRVCSNLVSFTSDLSSLTDGREMFNNCNNLTTFNGDLSSLTNGSLMFRNSKLNKESIINIINCLKNSNTCSSNAYLTLGIDASLKTDTELQTLLGITEGATSATLVGHGGGTWSIALTWR